MTTPAPRAGRAARVPAEPEPGGRGRHQRRRRPFDRLRTPDPAATRPAPPGPADPAGVLEDATVTAGQARAALDGAGTSSVMRSSGIMALGTLASRATGFLRTLVLAYVLSVGTVSVAYNNANTLPNAVYDLMLGGILTSVVVPLLVKAAKRDSDRGEAYEQRMFTLATLALFALTVIATLAAPLLVDLYASSVHGATHSLMVVFAYFFVPQIFFYGVSSLAGGVLNAHDRFAAPMWTPVINNLVVIAVLLLFITVGGMGVNSGTITAGQVQLLGFGTTLGIIAQTAALVPALRRAGFRWHPRFDFLRREVAEIMLMAGPLFGYILTTQIAFLVVQNVTNAANAHAPYDGFPAYSYAFQLFQLPYAVVGISVITALLPRMSAHAAERRYSEVKSDFSGGVRLASVIVVPSALMLGVLGAPFAEALFGHGRTTSAEAAYIGLVFGIFSLGLVPYMIFQLMLRVFYAMHDSRTPMFIGVAVMIANIAASLASLVVLPAGHVVEGVAGAFGLANLVGTVVSWRILSRRLRGLGGRQIARSLVRMHAAAVPGAVFALATIFMVGVIFPPGPAFGLVTVIIGGSGGLLLYLLFARALAVGEVSELADGLRSRLRR